MLQHSVSEKDKALERFVAAAQQRSAEREQSFEQQVLPFFTYADIYTYHCKFHSAIHSSSFAAPVARVQQ